MTIFGAEDGFALTVDRMGAARSATVFGGATYDRGFAVSTDGTSARFGGTYTGTATAGGRTVPDVGGGTDSVWFLVVDEGPSP